MSHSLASWSYTCLEIDVNSTSPRWLSTLTLRSWLSINRSRMVLTNGDLTKWAVEAGPAHDWFQPGSDFNVCGAEVAPLSLNHDREISEPAAIKRHGSLVKTHVVGLPVSMNVECGLISLSSGLEMSQIVIHEVLHRGFSSSTDIGGCFSVGRQSCSKIIRWWIFSSCPVDGCWTTSHWALGDPFTRRGNAQKHIRVMFILHPSPSFNFTGQCIEWQRMCVCQKDKSKHF